MKIWVKKEKNLLLTQLNRNRVVQKYVNFTTDPKDPKESGSEKQKPSSKPKKPKKTGHNPLGVNYKLTRVKKEFIPFNQKR